MAYDGFEPSGRMHIAQGILRALTINKLVDAGCIMKMWVADWFALINNKMGGDLKKIQVVGKYFIEIWKAAGMKMQNVKFLWASEEINKNASQYWLRVIDIAREFNLSRVNRCLQIMGRHSDKDGDKVNTENPAAYILYPCMQACDVFFLGIDICSLGIDQRKVNMLAVEYAEKKGLAKPVVVSHNMLPGLLEGQAKMGKSIPGSAIFMEDTEEEVNRKIKSAYCPKFSDIKPEFL